MGPLSSAYCEFCSLCLNLHLPCRSRHSQDCPRLAAGEEEAQPVEAPAEWHCPRENFSGKDGCHCNCGAWDPGKLFLASVLFRGCPFPAVLVRMWHGLCLLFHSLQSGLSRLTDCHFSQTAWTSPLPLLAAPATASACTRATSAGRTYRSFTHSFPPRQAAARHDTYTVSSLCCLPCAGATTLLLRARRTLRLRARPCSRVPPCPVWATTRSCCRPAPSTPCRPSGPAPRPSSRPTTDATATAAHGTPVSELVLRALASMRRG